MTERFETDLVAVRAKAQTLVEGAREGDDEAMLSLRAMALRAGVFAGLSVNNPVWRQEEQFAGWLAGRPIRGLPAHQCAERMGAWVAASMTLDLFDDPTGERFAAAACQIKFLGPAKSHFFAGLLGFERVPCIDVHMGRELREAGLMTTKTPPKGFPSYRRLVERSGWSTVDQWLRFLKVPPQAKGKTSFGQTQHACYFEAVLGR
jgi:hypothetical protein